MRKTIYVAAVVAIIALAGFFIVKNVFFKENTEAVKPPTLAAEPAARNISKLTDIPQGEVLSIGTPRGAVSVRNFYASALGAEEQFVILKKNENYEINYDTYTSGFSIYISAAPFAANRLAAEKDFLDILGIDAIEACKLNVWEDAAPGVRPDSSELGLTPHLVFLSVGLSFCANKL